MPVWFPPPDKLVSFIPEPPLGAGGFDDASYGTPEGSLDGLGDDDFFDSAQRSQDFGNASVSFNDDEMLYDGNDSMNYFDAMHDFDDLDDLRCVFFVLCAVTLALARAASPAVLSILRKRPFSHRSPLLLFACSTGESGNNYGGLAMAAAKLAPFGAAAAVASTAPTALQDFDLEGSGSLNMDDDFMSQAPVSDSYVPEQSMNLSKLLYDDDPPSLTESDAYDDVSMDLTQDKAETPSVFAPMAATGGVHAMMAVYNRLRSGNDDVDEDMPGIQEVMSMKHFSSAENQGVSNANRWAAMQHQGLSQSVAQESTRGGGTFFMQSNA